MSKHSPARAGWPLLPGLNLFFRGKVRDTYRLTNGPLLVVATDAISIFDHVLNALVPQKGVILNAMNHFWLNHLASFGLGTHFVAAGDDIDAYLPEALCNNADLQSRAMVVREFDMAPFEFVFRKCLTGSGLAEYRINRRLGGLTLPPGMQDGDELPCIVFTPTTKAETGHDEPVDGRDVIKEYPLAQYNASVAFQLAFLYAEAMGIVLADAKLELNKHGLICDEVFTPDAARFWALPAWKKSRELSSGRKAPPPFDKQLVRDWGKEQGINGRDPEKVEDVKWVHSLQVPPRLIEQTTQTYRYIFWRLTGMTVEQYLREKMGVQVPERPAKKVAIICGSASDLPVIEQELSARSLVACHQLPQES